VLKVGASAETMATLSANSMGLQLKRTALDTAPSIMPSSIFTVLPAVRAYSDFALPMGSNGRRGLSPKERYPSEAGRRMRKIILL
jgi:hypothetical protein